MEYVLIDNGVGLGVTLIWIKGWDSGIQKEFGNSYDADLWCRKAQIQYRWATYEETHDLI